MSLLPLYKFGKKEYLDKIILGEVRFKSAQHYVNQEKNHVKGIADIFDSGLNLSAFSGHLYLNGQEVAKAKMKNIQFNEVSLLPIFCCSYMNHRNLKLVSENGKEKTYKFYLNNNFKKKMIEDCENSGYDSVLYMDGQTFLSNIIESAKEKSIINVKHGAITYERTVETAPIWLDNINDYPNSIEKLLLRTSISNTKLNIELY